MIPDEPFDSIDFLHGATIATATGAADEASPAVLFVAGGALSGKTAVLHQLIDSGADLIPSEPVIVDPDLIRRMLPEWEPLYRAREPVAASALRAEAIDIARQIVERGCEDRRNLVLVGIGAGEPGEFTAAMRTFADADYEVRVLFVDAPVETELERNETRAVETGLRFDPAVVAKLTVDAAKRFVEWKDAPWIARFEVYSTAGANSGATKR